MKSNSAAIELLLSRKSHNKLIAPAPSQAQLDIMFKAAIRAPDHALLRPWRYRVYQGDSLGQLGELLAQAMQKSEPDVTQEKLNKIKLKPLRAPMVIVASVEIKEHKKVPRIEQILSAGASVQNLLMAAHFQGVGAMWRTGSLAFNQHLMDSLNFAETEEIVGFIYLGTEEGGKREAKAFDIDDFVTYVS
jgi:nitroreductase